MTKPETLTCEKPPVLCDGALTLRHFLTDIARVKPGDKALILWGAGSLGSAALQIAKSQGVHVSATASAWVMTSFSIRLALPFSDLVDPPQKRGDRT